MSASESKETDGKKPNHLIHVLNSPKTFIRMFTTGKCTIEEKQIQEILKCICALRNCGGGKLTILFTETSLKSETEKCVEIIKNAVDDALSDTRQLDLFVWTRPQGIIFFVSGSKKVVTIKYNLYFMTDSSLEFVSSTKSAEDIKLFLQKQDELLTEHKDFTKPKPQQVRGNLHMRRCTCCSATRESLSTTQLPDETATRKVKRREGAEHGTYKNENSQEVNKKVSMDQIQFVKGQQIIEPSKETITFKILKEDKFRRTGENSAALRIASEKNKLLPYVSAFANHKGGTLFYGVNSDGTVVGEKISESEMEKIRQTVKGKVESLVRSQHTDEGDKFWEIDFIPVEDKNGSDLKLHVIKISVKPCPGGVFIHDPESYYVVENRVEKMPLSKWMAHLRNSTTETSSKTSFIECQETFERIFLPDDYQKTLKSLGWVESFRIADENKECGTRHLEIVCKLGEVPRNADIIERFGEQILPFITYQKASKREWFESNIFDENCDIKQEYEDKFLSLSWIEDFYVGVTSEPEKSWQIFITCAPNTVPSMADLKKKFGTNIASFVEFIQESVDEDSKDSKESVPSSSYLRGPISGDELCVQESKSCGAIGIITGDDKKHYATTCYHVCFKEDFPKDDIKKGHEILKQDYANESKGCKGATCVYTTGQGETLLGQFCHGLYDDNHDIALIELEPSINCSDTVQFLADKSIKPVLANKKEVKDMLFEAELPVEIICRQEPTKGELFALTGVRRGPKYLRCYRIRRTDGRDFATEGDSGSLVYLIYENEKIPFAYVCMVIPESKDKVVYYCRSMNHSIEELIKTHMPESSMKPCLLKCGKTIVE